MGRARKSHGNCEGCGKPLKRRQRTCSPGCARLLGIGNQPHPEELREKVRELWPTELSCAQIGAQVGLSKNAIVGLRKRMGLPERPNPVKTTWTPEQVAARRAKQIAAQQAVAGAKAVVAARKVSAPRIRPPVVVVRKEEPAAAPIRRLARGPCQAVEGDKGRWVFCCEADAVIGSYCQDHASKFYLPRKQVQEAA